MASHVILALQDFITHFLPGAEVSVSHMRMEKLRAAHPYWTGPLTHKSGIIKNKKSMFIWVKTENDAVVQISISRTFSITISESKVLNTISTTIEGFLSDSSIRSIRTTSEISSISSLSDIVVARYLSSSRGVTFYSPFMIINELKKLALQRYEGSICTSGVIYTAEIEKFLSGFDKNVYEVEEFKSKVEFSVGFFDDPASYRYVDGRNSFFIVDNWRNVYGVLRIRKTSNFNATDRSNLLHIGGIGIKNSDRIGRMFVGIVGNNSDVKFFTPKRIYFHWKNLKWHMENRKTLVGIMNKYLDEDQAEKLNATISFLSDLRRGALILIADKAKEIPLAVGNINSTKMAEELKSLMRGKQFSDIVDTGLAVGLLTSDGLTVLDRHGSVIDAGRIIDLNRDTKTQIRGGGRTQAALAASAFGLVIKISEDGPISVYHDGILMFRS